MTQNVVIFSEKPSVNVHVDHYTIVYHSSSCNYEELMILLAKYNPLVLITIQDSGHSALNKLPFAWRKRWIDVPSIAEITQNAIDQCYFGALRHAYDKDWPLVSAITSTWCSGHKLLRPWRSLQSQTYTNWEWIIWDDSPDSDRGATYAEALKLADKDPRIKVFKAPRPSSVIGHMKRLACGAATGQFLFELDHDDDLVPECLSYLVDASKAHPECDFFYSDTMEVHEDRYLKRNYCDGFAFGHGSQMHYWHHGADCQDPAYRSGTWQVHMAVTPINDDTVTHLVGLPNHFRAWRTNFYWAIGGHSNLMVADDYDLLIRSLKCKSPVDCTNWCHIMTPAYIQYVNSNSNNFTFKRNAMIQHNVNWLRHNFGLRQMPRNTLATWLSGRVDRHDIMYRPFAAPKGLLVFRGGHTAEVMAHIINTMTANHGLIAVIEFAEPSKALLQLAVNNIAHKDKVHWWSLPINFQGSAAAGTDLIELAQNYVHLFYGVDLPLII